MEKVQCMSLSSIYIHYNHEALRAAGGLLGEWIGRVPNRELCAREPIARRACLLTVHSVSVTGGCLNTLVVDYGL